MNDPSGQPMQLQKVPKVFEAISTITGELSKIGIAKDRENKQQGYSFRGIDQVYNALAPLLAKHRLNILPMVLERAEKVVQSKSGGNLNFVTLKVNYAFVSAEDASSFMVTTYGEGMDSADKATNKALSAAYKYAVIQAFAIPVEGQPDADADAHEEAAPAPVKIELSPQAHDELLQAMKNAKLSVPKTLKYFEAADLYALDSNQMTELQGIIAAKMKEQKGAGSAQG